jgi:hypothetical protein
MQIDSPLWSLKQTCPCCFGDGILELYACNNCNKVVAKCDTLGTIFIGPLNISLDKISKKDSKECPFCDASANFRVAKDYEIIALGLTTNDYE